MEIRRLDEMLTLVPPEVKDIVMRADSKFTAPICSALQEETGLTLKPAGIGWRPQVQDGLPMPHLLGAELVPARMTPHQFAVLDHWIRGCHDFEGIEEGWKLDPEEREDLQRVIGNSEGISKFAQHLQGKFMNTSRLREILYYPMDILGAYSSELSQPTVVLYWQAIGLFAAFLRVPDADLAVAVLAHELAHAFVHLGRDSAGQVWPTTEYQTAPRSVQEGLAQYFADRVLDPDREGPFGSGPKDAFDELRRQQHDDYRAGLLWQLAGYTPQIVKAAVLCARADRSLYLNGFEGALEAARKRLS